ncbi:MAG TPA: ATP-binding protein [Sphingomonadaceae bacterium]|nr:ATP-binding protein [Sphingomonadaceae bacterium]
MDNRAPWARVGRLLAAKPQSAVLLAVALLAASLGLAIHNEHLGRTDSIHDATVQARILADSVAAPLAFDDAIATQEYVDALRANPDIVAAGAYDLDGHRAAGFAQSDAALPLANRVGPPRRQGGDLIVTAEVAQNGTRLGSVYLRATIEPWTRRALRYVGIAIILVMASLLIAVLGASYASIAEAHRRLREEVEGRQKAEDALRQSQKMEAMGQLTGGVAHDFNNLLMVASSGLELMDRTDDPARRARLMQGIRQAIDRGAKLTQQLLAFARRTPLKPEIIDLGAHVRGLQHLLDHSLRENVTVEIDMAADLGAVELDVSQFEVAMLNIAVNARDAMPNGGAIRIEGRNEPTAAATPPMVRLAIRDNGTGMPHELIEKVFEPFFTTKGVGQGTGLGLSQVYGFVRASGGRVEITSELGHGTTVTLLLPRSLKALENGPHADDGKVDRAARPLHVLLAEDDDQVADLVVQMLEELGYAATRTSTAAEALTTLGAGEAVDVLLSDMMMPGDMGGLDLAREVKRRRPKMPVILMTGYSAAAASARQEGIELLVKPYTLDVLGTALASATAR